MLILVNKQDKSFKEKKNYVIEFNKIDLKPHLILEKDANANMPNNKNNSQNNINNQNNQENVRESDNFYCNEGI